MVLTLTLSSAWIAVGCESNTNGTARRPLIHSISWSRRCVFSASVERKYGAIVVGVFVKLTLYAISGCHDCDAVVGLVATINAVSTFRQTQSHLTEWRSKYFTCDMIEQAGMPCAEYGPKRRHCSYFSRALLHVPACPPRRSALPDFVLRKKALLSAAWRC